MPEPNLAIANSPISKYKISINYINAEWNSLDPYPSVNILKNNATANADPRELTKQAKKLIDEDIIQLDSDSDQEIITIDSNSTSKKSSQAKNENEALKLNNEEDDLVELPYIADIQFKAPAKKSYELDEDDDDDKLVELCDIEEKKITCSSDTNSQYSSSQFLLKYSSSTSLTQQISTTTMSSSQPIGTSASSLANKYKKTEPLESISSQTQFNLKPNVIQSLAPGSFEIILFVDNCEQSHA
jgi:hypothetical protein